MILIMNILFILMLSTCSLYRINYSLRIYVRSRTLMLFPVQRLQEIMILSNIGFKLKEYLYIQLSTLSKFVVTCAGSKKPFDDILSFSLKCRCIATNFSMEHHPYVWLNIIYKSCQKSFSSGKSSFVHG